MSNPLSTVFVDLVGPPVSAEWLNAVGSALVPTPVLVSQLPTASEWVGYRSIVRDATTTTFATTVVGGGANIVPVYSDGTYWRIG